MWAPAKPWLVSCKDHSARFKDKVDLGLIKQVMSSEPPSGTELQGTLDQEIGDLRFGVQSTHMSTQRYKQLTYLKWNLIVASCSFSLVLSAQSLLFIILTLFMPSMHATRTEPSTWGDIICALLRIDKERPPEKIGDAARKVVRGCSTCRW